MEPNRTSWICIRCNKVCAPHIDYCNCAPTFQIIPQPTTIPIPYIPYQPFSRPIIPTPFPPYDYWATSPWVITTTECELTAAKICIEGTQLPIYNDMCINQYIS